MGGRRVECLSTRMRRERCIVEGGSKGPGWTVEVYKLKDPEEEVTVLVSMGPPGQAETQQEEHLQEWKLSRTLNLEKDSSEHLK